MSIPFQITQEDVAEADDVDFEEVSEKWNTYKLEDGTVLLIKVPLLKVKRLKKHQPDGNPVYIANVQIPALIRATRIPTKLKLKPEQPKEPYR